MPKEGLSMERTPVPLLEEIKAEAIRLSAAAGGEGGDEIFRLLGKLEEALRFLLAISEWASDKVAYPERLKTRLKELGLR
jgi:hypothetical protein